MWYDLKSKNNKPHFLSYNHQRFINNNEPLTNLLRITENNNRFIIKAILPSGDNILIKKRFQTTNKDQIRAIMTDIRQTMINEHYPNHA